MAEEHTYNSKDIQRYLQQQMSVEEMHAFEKVMMEDPFLADALEGYKEADLSIATKHLGDIHTLITDAKEDVKTVPLITRKTNWLRIAALFVLIAGVSLITYKLTNNTSQEKTIASTLPPKSILKNDTIKAIEPSQPVINEEVFSNKNIASNSNKVTSKLTAKPPQTLAAPMQLAKDSGSGLIAMQSINTDQKTRSTESIESIESLQRNTAAPKAMTMRQAFIQPELKGKVINIRGEPVAGASITTYNNSVTTDKNGNFSIKAPDSLVDVSVASVGFSPTNATLKSSDVNNKIVLNKSNESLSEVVVIGYGKKKEKQQQALVDAEPEGGWQNFNHYIDSSLSIAKANKEVAITGDVELEFLIDRAGKPVNIKTINSPDKTLEGKAIELIQKGPKWRKKDRKAKAKVVINF